MDMPGWMKSVEHRLTEQDRRIRRSGIPGFPDTVWTALSLTNSWVAYGGSFPTPRYRRMGGIVYIQAAIKNGSLNGPSAFQMPVGFRPTGILTFACADSTTADLQADGTMGVYAPANSLNRINVTFPAEQ